MSSKLPVEIMKKLAAYRRRRRTVEALSGLGLTVTIFLLLLFVGTALDRFVFLSDAIRVLITIAGYAVSAALACIAILWPMIRIRSDRKIAAQIEAVCPELEEGLLTSIELADAEAGGKLTGVSQHMIEQTARQIDEKARSLSVERLVPSRRTMAFLGVAGACVVVLAILLAFPGSRYSRMVLRYLNPLGNYERVSSTLIKVPGDRVVGEGDDVRLTADIDGSPADNATLFLRSDSQKPWEAVAMERAGDNAFAANLLRTRNSFEYRVRAGDGESAKFNVTVRKRPEVTSLTLTYRFPEYTGWEPSSIPNADGDIRALKGTRVEFSGTTSQPLTSIELNFKDGPKVALSADDTHFNGSLDIVHDGTYRIQLVSRDGLENLEPVANTIVAITDEPPAVTLDEPASGIRAGAGDLIDVRFHARDDVKVMASQVIVADRKRTLHIPVQTTLSGDREVQGGTRIDLLQSGLTVGDALELWVECADGLKQVGKSAKRALEITAPGSAAGFDDILRLGEVENKQIELSKSFAQAKESAGEVVTLAGQPPWGADHLAALEKSRSSLLAVQGKLLSLATSLRVSAGQTIEPLLTRDLTALAALAENLAHDAIDRALDSADRIRLVPENERLAVAKELGKQLDTAGDEAALRYEHFTVFHRLRRLQVHSLYGSEQVSSQQQVESLLQRDRSIGKKEMDAGVIRQQSTLLREGTSLVADCADTGRRGPKPDEKLTWSFDGFVDHLKRTGDPIQKCIDAKTAIPAETTGAYRHELARLSESIAYYRDMYEKLASELRQKLTVDAPTLSNQLNKLAAHSADVKAALEKSRDELHAAKTDEQKRDAQQHAAAAAEAAAAAKRQAEALSQDIAAKAHEAETQSPPDAVRARDLGLLADALHKAEEGAMSEAARKADQSAHSDDVVKAQQASKEAPVAQDVAEHDLKWLGAQAKKLENEEKAAKLAQRAHELAGQQAQIALRKERPLSAAETNELLDRQRRLAGEAREITHDLENVAETVRKEDPKTAAQLDAVKTELDKIDAPKYLEWAAHASQAGKTGDAQFNDDLARKALENAADKLDDARRHELSSAKDARDELRQKLGTASETIDRLAAAQDQQAQTATALRNDALARPADQQPFRDAADAAARKEADARADTHALAQRTEREAKALADRAGADPEKVRDMGSAARSLKQIAD